MFMGLLQLLFSFKGRVARSTFWGAALVLGFSFVVLLVFLETQFGRNSSLILYPPFFWAMAAISSKRLHDRGKPAPWFLVLLIPVLGPLWLLVELGLRRGTIGENQYGADPYDARPDYLTVN